MGTSERESGASGGGVAEMKRQINDARRRMEEDDGQRALMARVARKNIDDSDFAADGVQMKVVDLDKLKNDELGDELPLYYDPELIASYWSRRPAAEMQRVGAVGHDRRVFHHGNRDGFRDEERGKELGEAGNSVTRDCDVARTGVHQVGTERCRFAPTS